MKRLVVFGLAAVLVGTTACATSPGQPTSVTTTGGADQTTDTGQPTTSSGGDSLPVSQPCNLLMSSELQQIGASSPPSQDNVGTASSCEIETSSFTIGLDIRSDAGLSAFTGVSGGGTVKDVALGHHQAKEQDDPNSSSCTVAIGVSDSSRVDVSATGDGTTDPCPTAENVAKLVDPKLP